MISPLPYDVRTNIVWSDMLTAVALMDSVASGRKPMQLLSSASGFGKTTIAKKRFRKHGIVSEADLYNSLSPLAALSPASFPNLPPALLKAIPQNRKTALRRAVNGRPPFENAKRKFFIEARPTKAISLVRTLHLCSMLQASALLFDDPGRIAGDEASCDILKTSFGMQRTVTFETPEITRNENWRISAHAGYDPFVPPPDFPIPAGLRWLWLANTNYTDPAVLAKLGDHFAPLIARGLNPFWIRDDAEHDHRDLFLYVHYKATEENLLRSMGFSYEVSRKAVNFFVTYADWLVDLCPRRLELIARAFAANQPPAALEAELRSMAPSVIRPNLRLPTSWVTVPDGVLLWPESPFSKEKPPVEGEPPRRIRKRERAYKRLHPQPDATPDPDTEPPPAETKPVQPDPEPDPDPTPSWLAQEGRRPDQISGVMIPIEQRSAPAVADPERTTTPEAANDDVAPPSEPERGWKRRENPFDAINEVYRLPIETTCQMVADVLRQYPLDQWDRDDFDRLGEGLEGRAEWQQCIALAETYVTLDCTNSHKVFCTEAEGVLEYRDGCLEICSWGSIEQRIPPAVAEAKEKRAQRLREQRGRDILKARLPKVRKLKAMKALIDEILTCQPTISVPGQQVIEHIRAMQRDDPQFADCVTFMQYLDKAHEIIEQIPEAVGPQISSKSAMMA